jgi:hypothetical protein
MSTQNNEWGIIGEMEEQYGVMRICCGNCPNIPSHSVMFIKKAGSYDPAFDD